MGQMIISNDRKYYKHIDKKMNQSDHKKDQNLLLSKERQIIALNENRSVNHIFVNENKIKSTDFLNQIDPKKFYQLILISLNILICFIKT